MIYDIWYMNVPEEKWEIHWKNAVLIGTNYET